MKILNILFFLLLFFFSGCKKNEKKHPVPNVNFDITINIDLPSYNALIGVSGWAYVDGGVKGIIIYRKSIDEFVAFDRRSPEDEDGQCATALTPKPDSFLQLKDACSGAEFSLIDGSAISGSEYGLRQYQTVWNGTNMLRIFN